MMSILTARDHGREPPADARSRPGQRAGGAARWLALAVITAAGALSGAGLAATPARAATTVMVNTTSDEVTPADGACSLREAILYAENLNGSTTDCGTWATGTTTIIVPAGHYNLVPDGDAHLVIGYAAPGPIVIIGAGLGTFGTIIDAQGHSPRLLLVGAGENVTIKNLTLQGGVAYGGGVSSTPASLGDGGGIDNLGTLTLDDVAVTGNQTQSILGVFPGQDRGGGIFNTGTLTLLDSRVEYNSTEFGIGGRGYSAICAAKGDDGSPGADGGGLYNQGGTVTAINTIFTGNTTGAGGPGGFGADSRTANYYWTCKGGGNGGAGGHGGSGAGIFNDQGLVTLAESAVYGNTTGTGGSGGAGGFGPVVAGWGGPGGSSGSGAGLLNDGMLTVVNTTITGNATGPGAAGGAAGQTTNPAGAGVPGGDGTGGVGGGIYQENGQATAQESTIALNVTGLKAGPYGANPVRGYGSGIEVWQGELTEINTIVSNNDCQAVAGQIKDGLAPGDGHLNLTFPATTTCPGIVADPGLGPLWANGGPTPTMAIAPPSPAINRIPPLASAGCTPTDQRGIPRPQPAGGLCDIGAYEYKP